VLLLKLATVGLLVAGFSTANGQVDRLFGHETSLQVNPYYRALQRDRAIGLSFHLAW
jgi:hypothetical protein